MEFGWINIFGAAIVVLIMIPNIIYAGKQNQPRTGKPIPKHWSVCEQLGRYGCIFLMWLPLFVWKFGFGSVKAFLIYLIANGVLLLSYYLFWAAYAKKKTLTRAMALASIPSVLFLLSGILLRHWALAAFAVLFGISHCKITYLTHRYIPV